MTPRSFRVDEVMIAQNHTLEQCLAQYCSTNIGDKLPRHTDFFRCYISLAYKWCQFQCFAMWSHFRRSAVAQPTTICKGLVCFVSAFKCGMYQSAIAPFIICVALVKGYRTIPAWLHSIVQYTAKTQYASLPCQASRPLALTNNAL